MSDILTIGAVAGASNCGSPILIKQHNFILMNPFT